MTGSSGYMVLSSVIPVLGEGGTGILTSFLVPHNGGKGGAVQNFVLDSCVCDLTLLGTLRNSMTTATSH